MPQRGDIPVNNFVRGLVTEASPLTFPPGASLDEVNFELLRDGSRRRRLGLDLEDNYGLLSSGLDSAVLEGARCQAYRWSIPNGNIDQDIGVVQIGNQIWFLDLYTANPSANILNGGNPIVATELNNDVIMTFTTLNNYLIGVANHLPQPYLFNYDPATDTVTVETAAIAIRDMWGVDDGLSVDGRPTALTPTHHYNLLNQGWLPDIQSTCGAGINAIDCTFNTFGIYPSNSDVWTYGRVEDLTSVDVKKFDPDIAGRNFVNNGNVARGHYIISLYERGVSRSNQTGFTLPVDRETGRINAIAAFAGRIFYAGILSKVVGGDSRSPNLSGTVLFSQLFENKLNLVKCYQEADPTSPDINDIVDTDGGLIQIPECGYIWALKAIKESLFVFASNGVWEIRGGDNGFTATSFMVHKISNVGVYAPKSIVEVEGVIYFWAATGIHAIGRNENGVFQTTNLTIPTIQKLYNAIPDASKKNARGYYDLAQNRARWLYYSPETKEFGEAIDIDEVPAPLYTLLGEPLQITNASISTNQVTIVRISNTKYVIVCNHTTGSKFQYIVCNCDESTFTVTNTTPADLVTGISGFSFLKATSIDETKFLLTTGTTSGGFQARIINISGNTCTANAPVTIKAVGSNEAINDVIQLNPGRALVSIHRPSSIGNPFFVVINYSSGTPVMGALFTSSISSVYVELMRVLTLGSTCTVMYYSGLTARVLTISSSDVITEGSILDLSPYTFQGGNHFIGEISSTELILMNSPGQAVIITKTDPPTITAFYNATDGVLKRDSNRSGHSIVKIPNKREVARYILPSDVGPTQNRACYQYLGISGTTVVETKAVTPMLPSIGDPSVAQLTPITLNQSIESSAWVAYMTSGSNPNKIVTQMLRLI